MSEHFRIGTRGSRLALWQAHMVRDMLIQAHEDENLTAEIVVIKSSGDLDRTRPLEQLGGEGLFTKELEHALEEKTIDLAVHSLKDLPIKIPDRFELSAFPPRGPIEDALVSRSGATLEFLPEGATIATGSPRRKAQLLNLRPDLNIVGIRGNVPTRLEKLESENLDAIVLAKAGLERLGFSDRITQTFPPDLFYPAVGQGAVAVEVRITDVAAIIATTAINDKNTRASVEAERGFLSGLGGGCQLPVGAHAHVDDAAEPAFLNLAGLVTDRQGKEVIRADMTGPLDKAWELGQRLATLMIGKGAKLLLKE